VANGLLALSRTCHLGDFDDCLTVADWQQELADRAWERWEAEHHIRTREHALCMNWSGCTFIAPGPEAIYRYPGQKEAEVERALPAVYGLSVLDHTEAPVRFLSRTAQILRKDGLLFLTFAIWNAQGDDIAAGHRERVRIYDTYRLKKLVFEARRLGLQTFGGMDWAYHGNTLDDHSLASLVLTRR
jgi:hypothetical protein